MENRDEITMKRLVDGKWEEVKLPPLRMITAKDLRQYVGASVALRYRTPAFTMYAAGNETVMNARWANDKPVMPLESFANYWAGKVVEMVCAEFC